MILGPPPPAAPGAQAAAAVTAADAALRAGAEEICEQLCTVVAGDFGFRIETRSADEMAQKLALLSNFVLDAARRALERAEAKAAELRDAHRVARIGTWRRDLLEGTLELSEELHALLGTDPRGFDGTHEALLALVHRDDRAGAAAFLACAAAGERAVEHECRVLRRDGTTALLWAEARPERDGAGRVVAVRGVCQGVTERRATAARIYELAHHDALTGLANRVLLQERLAEAVARARRAGGGGGTPAVLCLDLDGFKAVNDLHGHAAGDALLREVAARLRRCVRATDTVARLGGDEFVVLQAEAAQPAAARALSDRLLAALAEPYEVGPGAQGNVTASIGVAVFPGDGDGPAALLKNADTALYRAKSAGRNGATFFRPEMDRELRERRRLSLQLHFR
jgi:diguanylate cyclase (GGDEF)-like protein